MNITNVQNFILVLGNQMYFNKKKLLTITSYSGEQCGPCATCLLFSLVYNFVCVNLVLQFFKTVIQNIYISS